MSAARQAQNNTSWYPAITMASLFLISLVFAIIFYVKYADELALKIAAESFAKDMSASQRTAVENFDELFLALTGQTSDAKTDAKLNTAKIEINETIAALETDAIAVYGEKGFDLLQTITSLKAKLDQTRKIAFENETRISELQEDFDITLKEYDEAAIKLNAEKDKYLTQLNEEIAKYEDLKRQMELSTDEKIQIWAEKLNKTEDKLKQQNIELLRSQTDLNETKTQLKEALKLIAGITPAPDNEILAFEPDGHVYSADLQTGLIYLDIGRKDHVYVGLTFKVFEKDIPMPEDGRGKAEIEIFRVTENASVARLIASSKKNPVVENDIIVNMIWDRETSNSFMIVGEFDFDGDGMIDRDGRKKIEQLITQWGGKIDDKLTINTNFLVVGTEPRAMKKPTLMQMDNDPGIEQKYENSLIQVAAYDQVIEKANTLSVPIFDVSRFLRLIGYKTQAEKSSAL